MFDESLAGPRGSFKPLDTEQCWELAGSEPVGRLGFVADSYPRIFPVNHTIHEKAIYFRTSAYGQFARQILDGPVAFEVDRILRDDWSGWSVLAIGRAQRVEESEKLAALWSPHRVHPWAAGVRNLWIEIQVQEISGRTVRS